MNNITIELPNAKAEQQIQNGYYTLSFPPITINNGDTIQLRNAFIDTLQQTYDQIHIPEDINITFQFAFFEHCFPKYGGTRVLNPDAPNEPIPYAIYFATLGFSILKAIKQITIKKGLYTPNSIAVEISRQLSITNISKRPQQPYNYDTDPEHVNMAPRFYSLNSFMINIFEYGLQQYQDFSRPCQSAIMFALYDSNTNNVDMTNTYKYFFQVPSRNPASGAELYAEPKDLMVGAREISILYDNENSNLFEFGYMHTPYYDANGNESVGLQAYTEGGNTDVYKITRDSGIVFTDIQPQSARDFLTTLGFDLNSMIATFGEMRNYLIPTNFNSDTMTTENLFTIDDILFSNSRLMPTADDWNNATDNILLKVSDRTRSIQASQYYSIKTLSPFYMVELITNFNTNYVSGIDKSKFINGVVSRNYTQNNYITGYTDSGLTYKHIGESLLLSSITVRILNPDTKDVATDLGPNSYILLDVQRQ